MSPERFDRLVIVRRLPGPPILELAAALHAVVPHLPILLATASADEIDAAALVAAGVPDVVRWPVIAADLAVALRGAEPARPGTHKGLAVSG
jgi:CheY-like chemotaxis protein